MSVHVLGEVAIGDIETFLDVFGTDGQALRAEHGCADAVVYAVDGDPNRVMVLMRWPDQAAFDAFRADPRGPSTMARGSAQGRPAFTVLQQVGAFPT